MRRLWRGCTFFRGTEQSNPLTPAAFLSVHSNALDCTNSPSFIFHVFGRKTIKTLLYFPKASTGPLGGELLEIRMAELSQSLLFELSPPPPPAGLSQGRSCRLIGLWVDVRCLPAVLWDEPVEGKEVLGLPYRQHWPKAWTASLHSRPPQRPVRTRLVMN